MIRVFRVFVATSAVALLISEALLIMGSYILAVFILFRSTDDPIALLLDERLLTRIIILDVIILLGLYFQDLYTEFRIRSYILLLQQLCFTVGMAFLFQAILAYVRRDWIVPKWLMIEGGFIVIITLFLWRVLFTSTLLRAGRQQILFVGSSPVMFQVAEHLRAHPQFGMQPMGYLSEGEEDSEQSIKKLGTIEDLSSVVTATRPDRIVVGMTERRRRLPVTELLEFRFAGIHTEEIAMLYEATFGRVCAREIRPSQLIFSGELGPNRHSLRVQRAYSILMAAVGLVITFPVMLLVGLLIRMTSPGPILIRQTRVGMNNKLFTIFKFRSMYQDAESRTGAVWATRNDPRITPLGQWLRKLRLDELPQLFNVIQGDMSIVGPRPERPEFVSTLSEQIPYYPQRHCVMPGITGWAQINYKYGDTIEDTIMKLEYDLYYIKHIAFSLDVYIMFHTVKTMLLFRGAQ